jgi:hypothetical protein
VTICAAWIRKSGDSEELIFVTDSRLRSFGSWDCNPKIYTFARSDFAMCFSGDTIFSYPMMIQLKNEIELNTKIRNRYQRLSVFKGVVLKILNEMLDHKSDYEVPDVEFLFGGYCWYTKEFKLWKFVYQKDIKQFTHHTVKFWRGVKSAIKVVFSGDYLNEAKDRLVNLLKERDKFENGCLDMEPLEVIRDMLLDSNADTKFHLIGGPPQMVKVYKSLNRVAFGVKWKIDGEEVVTLFGKPVKSFRNMPLPIVNPITLEYSNTNAYS